MKNAIVFDWKQTLYDPETDRLIEGARELLQYLDDREVPMALVGKGGASMHEAVKRLSVGSYFFHIYFQEGNKQPHWYTDNIKDFHKGMIFIGDKLDSEIEVGNRLGVITIRVRQGKFATDEPKNKLQKPKYTVNSLSECKQLLKKLLLR